MIQLFSRICGRRKDRHRHEDMKMTCVDSSTEKTIYQPLHPSVRPLLDPEYVVFHDKYAQYVEPEHSKPWDPSVRTRYTWPNSGSPIVEVGSVEDIRPCPNFAMRLFTPAGTPPVSGWPLFLWFHGGGFVLGNIDSDNDLCALVCKEVGCMVANVDYRLAPEHLYPAAIEDVVDALQWCTSDQTAAELRIDRGRIAIGGASAGANIAAVGALRAVELSIPIALQILVVPVTDNTATLDTWWSSHPHSPWLTPPRLTWYRNLYLKDLSMAEHWKVSPIFAPKPLLSKVPHTFIAIADQDLVSAEGIEYGKKLHDLGVKTQIQLYKGMPHSMMALSGAVGKGRQCMEDIVHFMQENM